MRVWLTQAAEIDLERIGDFIARENPQRAASFVAELQAACLRLADAPLAFPLVPRYERFGVHRRVHGNYLVFYCVDGTDIFVLHVLHGAMDYEAVLFPDAGA